MNDICFIVGPARSGTTWLGHMMIEHSDAILVSPTLFGLPEPLFEENGREVFRRIETGMFLKFPEEHVTRVIQSFAEDNPGKTLVEKTPLHLHRMAQVFKLYPRAKVACACRDFEATVASMARNLFTRDAPGSDGLLWQWKKAGSWALYNYDAIRRWRGDPRVYMVQYEELCEDCEGVFGSLLRFVGLDDSEAGRIVEAWPPRCGNDATMEGLLPWQVAMAKAYGEINAYRDVCSLHKG